MLGQDKLAAAVVFGVSFSAACLATLTILGIDAPTAPNSGLWVAPNVAIGGNLATRLPVPYWQRAAPYQPVAYAHVAPKPTSTTALAVGGAGLGPTTVTREEGKALFDTQTWRFLDLRDAKASPFPSLFVWTFHNP